MFDNVQSKNKENSKTQLPKDISHLTAGLDNAKTGGPSAEDMFAGVGKQKPEVFQPKKTETPANSQDLENSGIMKNPRKFFIFLILALGVILIASGGVWAYQKFLKPPAVLNNKGVNPISEPAAIKNNKNNQVKKPGSSNKIPVANQEIKNEAKKQAALDSDQDGLSDAEEKSLGTNLNSPDSDSDGLFDREEVKVYHTDPLNPDTDGDGYSDGQEVKQGYNPKGPGKLYEIKK